MPIVRCGPNCADRLAKEGGLLEQEDRQVSYQDEKTIVKTLTEWVDDRYLIFYAQSTVEGQVNQGEGGRCGSIGRPEVRIPPGAQYKICKSVSRVKLLC